MRTRVTRIVLESFIHNTEDKEKVLAAIQNCVGEVGANGEYDFNDIKGHFGNDMVFVEYRVKKPNSVLPYLLTQLKNTYSVQNLIDIFLYEKELFLRVDKQAAFKGKFFLKEGGDIIKIKIKFQGKEENIPPYLEKLLEENFN